MRRCLCLYFRTVFEGDPHIVCGVDGHKIHQSAPEVCLKIGDQSVLLPENLEELLNSASPCLFIGDLLGDGTQFDFSFIVAVDQSVIAFLVFCLVKGHMSIFVDALFNRIGKHLYFLNQCSFLGLQRREVKGKGQAAGQGCDDGILLGKKLVDCRNKVAVDKDIYGECIVEFTKKRTEKTAFRPFVIHGDRSIPITKRWDEYIDYYLGIKTIDEMSFDVPRTRKSLERVAANCDLSDCVFQVRSSGVRALSIDNPLPTLTVLNSGGGAHIPILSKERRHLSVNEMKRVMGFPDNYDFTAVSRTDAAKQLANAVCPPVIESVFRDIVEAIGYQEE